MPDVAQLAATLAAAHFTVRDEVDLQAQIAEVLRKAGEPFEEQVILGPGERVDFLVGAVGVELKTKGGHPDLVRQLGRYAGHDRVEALLVVTTRRQHHVRFPITIDRKPVLSVWVGSL